MGPRRAPSGVRFEPERHASALGDRRRERPHAAAHPRGFGQAPRLVAAARRLILLPGLPRDRLSPQEILHAPRPLALSLLAIATIAGAEGCRRKVEPAPTPAAADTAGAAQRRADSLAALAARRRADSI